MKLKSALIVAAVASAFSVSAQAATIFSDNFDSLIYAPNTTNWSPQGGWFIANNGTVDLIGDIPSPNFDFLPGNGNYIDLDGSSTVSGLFSYNIFLNANTQYNLSFDLAGSNTGSTNQETVAVIFGLATPATYTRNYNDPFSTQTLNFTPGSSGLYTFSFQNQGPSDNVGALLDNVSVTAVPEPESYAMIMAGLGLMGFLVRRRRNGQV